MGAEKKTILLIEDSQSTRFVYREFLERHGFTVLEAGDGKGGIKMINEKYPDAVILDLILPDIHGLEVLKQIRLNARTKSIPVLVLTNVKDAENMQKTMNLGANYYANKESFTPEKTMNVIQGLLKKRTE
jgi:two-component system NtrC family sensor kinase